MRHKISRRNAGIRVVPDSLHIVWLDGTVNDLPSPDDEGTGLGLDLGVGLGIHRFTDWKSILNSMIEK